MIQIKDITKRYDKFVALENFDLTIPTGSIFGLVGINGAGKSTLLRLIAGVLKADSGQILIDEQSIYENELKKRELLFLPDEPFYTPLMNGSHVADLYKTFYTFDDTIFRQYADTYNLNLTTPLRNFSKGMKRRLFIAIAFASAPKYLLLDEIFDGIDPAARLIFRQGLVDLVTRTGTTVVIASHSLRELEDICDGYGLIDGKRIASSGTLSDSLDTLHKFQIAFGTEVSRQDLGFECMTYESSGRIIKIVFRGDKDECLAKISALKPLVIDEMPVDFEELFISGVSGRTDL